MLCHHGGDHRPDGCRLALTAAVFLVAEEVKAERVVVGLLLLGQEQGEAEAVGQTGPAAIVIEGGGGLRTAMQGDDERGARRQTVRNALVHAEVAGVRAELGHLAGFGGLRQAGRSQRQGGSKGDS